MHTILHVFSFIKWSEIGFCQYQWVIHFGICINALYRRWERQGRDWSYQVQMQFRNGRKITDSPQHLQNLATCWLYWTATLCAADLFELPVLISGNIWRNINMGWEYRVFMPAPCSVTLPGVRGARETREDTYIPVSPGWAQIKIDVMKTLAKVSVKIQNFLVVLVPPCNPREIWKWTMNRVD